MKFISFVQNLQCRGQLDRLIFDECHLIVLAASYRHVMKRLKQLRLVNIQFIFLTATLSQSNETKLNFMMLLFSDSSLTMRAFITQKRIHYSIKFFQKQL